MELGAHNMSLWSGATSLSLQWCANIVVLGTCGSIPSIISFAHIVYYLNLGDEALF